MPRQPGRRSRREQRYALRKAAAQTGRQSLDVAWDWLLAELTALRKVEPARADAACQHLAGQIEQIARDTAGEVSRADRLTVR